MSPSKPTRGGPPSRRGNFYSPLDLPDQDYEELLPDPQSEEDDEQPPVTGNRYVHLALPPRAPENLPTPFLEGSASPEKWTVETTRRFDIPGRFESEEEGSVDDWGSSEELEPDKHLVVRHSEPARDSRHKAPANPQSEVKSLGKKVEHQSSRSPLTPGLRPGSSLQATARSIAPKIHALLASAPSPGIGERKGPSEDSPAKSSVGRKERISGTTFDREGDRDVVTTSAREPLDGRSLVQPNRSNGQPIPQSRRGRSPYGNERAVSSALTGRTSHQISGKELPQGNQQKAYPPPSGLYPPSHGMAKEPTSLEHTMQQGRSGGRERQAGLERSATPSDRPEDGMEEPSPEKDALPLPGQARQPDRNRLPSRDARQQSSRKQSSRKITAPNENQSKINRLAPPTAHDGAGGALATNTPPPPAGDTKDRQSSRPDLSRDSSTRSVSIPRSGKDRSGLNSRPPSTRPPKDHNNVSQPTEHRRKQGPMQQGREKHSAPMPSEPTPGPVDHAFAATASHPSRRGHGISSQHPSQPPVYPSESEASLPGDVKDSPRGNAARPSGSHPDTPPIRPPQSNAGLLTPQTGHNDRDTHMNTDFKSRPRGILGAPQQPQNAPSADKARMVSEDQSPPVPRQRAVHQYNPASQPPAASDADSHQKTTGSTSSRAATNDAASHGAGRQQPSPPLAGDRSAGTQRYPLHGGQQPIWNDDAFQQPRMPNTPIKEDPQDHRVPPSQEQQGHARGQGVQKPRKDQQKSDSIPNNIPTTNPAQTRPSASSKVDPRPKSPAPGAAGAGFNGNHATTTPATKHRTKKDPQETVAPSQKGTPENKTSDADRSIGNAQPRDPVPADRPDLNHRGGLDSSAPGAGTNATDYATVESDGKGYGLIDQDAQLQVISEEICSTILEGELSGLLEKALGANLLSAFSALPTWRQDELCREAVQQATAELSEFVDAVVAQTDS